MLITATLSNVHRENEVTVATGEQKKKLIIPSKALGKGSSVNGGELLFLSIATCYCNDLYREADRRDIEISSIEVTVRGEFSEEGAPATNVVYEVRAESANTTAEELSDLIRYVDEVAEVHNSLRKGISVSLRLHETRQSLDVKQKPATSTGY